jgi:hypothetical protein
VSLKYFFPEEEADLIEQRIDCKGYWRWRITLEIYGFLAFSSIGRYSKEHSVSETGSVSVLRWRYGRHLLYGVRKEELISDPVIGFNPF